MNDNLSPFVPGCSRRDFLAGVAAVTSASGLSLARGAQAQSPAAPASPNPAGASATTGAMNDAAAAGPALMPWPAHLQMTGGRLTLAAPFSVAWTGARDPGLEAAVNRTVAHLSTRTGMALLPVAEAAAGAATLTVSAGTPLIRVPRFRDDESYSLVVTPGGATLRAVTGTGILRGLSTLLQLLNADQNGYGFPALTIQDAPRFPWRGLLIDISRHWQPAEVLMRNLDAMEAVKLNVLHLHASDDQGFRIQSKLYPRLTEDGSDGLYYTQQQVRDLVAYAAERGIRILPEFDMPGHSTSWLVGYPQLGSVPGPYHIARHFGVHNNAFDPTREEVYDFLDGFLGEMSQLFPDEYLHIGGDENRGQQWSDNPRIVNWRASHDLVDNHALQAYFNRRISAILTRYGKKMAGWEEILNPALPRTILVQAWLSQAALADIARRGNDGILSYGYYLDLMWPAASHYAIDPLPADTNLTPDQAAHILGGEACMWGEYISPETIDSQLWPRLACIAERLWSPREVNNVSSMYSRLDVVNRRLEDFELRNRTWQGMMLRRLAGADDIGPLLVLAEAVEPAKGYSRGDERTYTSFTPLTHYSDAVPPESRLRRLLPQWVDELLAEAPHFSRHAQLQQLFSGWTGAHTALMQIVGSSPELREIEPLAQQLNALGQAGLDSLDHLASGHAPSNEWLDAQLAALAAASKIEAEMIFIVVPPLAHLVYAAATVRSLRRGQTARWLENVNALATGTSAAAQKEMDRKD